MITFRHTLAGDEVTIHCLEPGDDPQPVLDFVSSLPVVGFDTESTGLDIYSPDYRVRLAQFGSATTSYVLRVDSHADAIREAVKRSRVLAAHNQDHDLLSIAVGLGVPLEDTYGKTWCSLMMSKLADPYGALKRIGKADAKRPGKLVPQHGLKPRTRQLVDASCDIEQELSARFRQLKLKKADGYAQIPIDDEIYLRYAGIDPILAVRLLGVVRPWLTDDSVRLLGFERQLAYTLATMRHRGVLVDEQYTREQIAGLDISIEQTYAQAEALGMPVRGIAKNDEKSVFIPWLAQHGVKVTYNDNENAELSKKVLAPLVAGTSAEPAVTAFYQAREMEKNRRDYLQKFLDGRDANGRLHPVTNGMGAITDRMSMSDPPLHQIPQVGDIRGCLTADLGRSLVPVDLSQIEFRGAAALADEPRMKEAIKRGIDLHAVTAHRLYGPDFTDQGRTIAKRAGFGKIYGAGPGAVAQQCGVTYDVAQKAMQTFDRTFPGIAAYARKLQRLDEVVTPFGRRIPVDPKRPYAAINYMVQSTARDVFAYSMMRLVDAGLGPYLWLPIHDEIIVNVPEDQAAEVGRLVQENLKWDLCGVPVVADAKVLGKRWAK